MVPSHTGGAQDHPLLNRIKDFGGLDSETCSSPRAYAYVEKRGGTARACVYVRARRTRKGDGGRDAYRDEISKRNRGKEEARSRAHVSFLSFSFPPFPFFTRRSEHGESAFREEEGDVRGRLETRGGGGRRWGIVSGRTRAIPAFARTSRDPATAHPTTIPQPLLRFIRCSPSPLDWPPVAFLPAAFGHVTQHRACCHDRAVSPSPPRHRFASLPSTNFQHSLARRLASSRLSPTRSIQRPARSSVLPPRVSNFPFSRSTRRYDFSS